LTFMRSTLPCSPIVSPTEAARKIRLVGSRTGAVPAKRVQPESLRVSVAKFLVMRRQQRLGQGPPLRPRKRLQTFDRVVSQLMRVLIAPVPPGLEISLLPRVS